MSDSLIATTSDIESTRDGGTGFGFWEECKDISRAIDEGSWIDAGLAGFGAGLEVAGTVIDPFDSLMSMGVSWAMEQVEPLKEPLDWLTGDPGIIETHAATWENIADEMFAMADELQAGLDGDLEPWQGTASEAYQDTLDCNIDLTASAAGCALGMAAARSNSRP